MKRNYMKTRIIRIKISSQKDKKEKLVQNFKRFTPSCFAPCKLNDIHYISLVEEEIC